MLEYLIQWDDLLLENATWEGTEILQHPPQELLGGKTIKGGGLL